MAGLALFLLCALAGEGRARRLQRRERTLERLQGLIRDVGDRQLSGLVSFREGALRCPPSPERDLLLALLGDEAPQTTLLSPEELDGLAAYARSESRSLTALRTERDALLERLQRERDRTKEESVRKGQVCRSVGYLLGAAALLLVL